MKKFICLVSCATLFLTACNASPASSSPTPTPDTSILVEAQTPVIGEIGTTNSFVGKLSSAESLNVFPKIAGKVKSVYVKVGQAVNEGDLLFEFDTEDIKRQEESARASLNLAKANASMTTGSSAQSQSNQAETALESAQLAYENAESTFNAMFSLFEIEAVSQSEFDQAERGLEQARIQLESAQKAIDLTAKSMKDSKSIASAQVSQAQKSYDSIKSQLDSTQVKAEKTGVITMLNVRENEPTSNSQIAAIISNESKMKLQFVVSSGFISSFSEGMSVDVEVNGAKSKASLTEVGNMADDSVGGFMIKAEMPNPNFSLKSGMEATVTVKTSVSQNAMLLPLRSVKFTDGKSYVYLAKDSKAVRQEVATGISTETEVEVLSGISTSDIIITSDHPLLKEGAAIRVSQ